MMNTKYKAILFIAIVAILTACSNDEPSKTNSSQPVSVVADTVVRNGNFYTLVPDTPWVEAVAIKDGGVECHHVTARHEYMRNPQHRRTVTSWISHQCQLIAGTDHFTGDTIATHHIISR